LRRARPSSAKRPRRPRRTRAAATAAVRPPARAKPSTISSSRLRLQPDLCRVRPSRTYTEFMALLSPADQDKLRDTFADMTSPVKIVFFTQTLGCDTCLQTRQIIDELPVLTDKVTIEEANLVLDTDKAKLFGVERAPTLAIVGVD